MSYINKNVNLIKFDFSKEDVFFSNKNFFYVKGYYLLWSYNRLPNFFVVNSKLWLNEEEKRKISFRYWSKIEAASLTAKDLSEELKIRKIDSLRRMQFDIKNYIFYINILFNFLKLQQKNDLFIFSIFFDLFKKESFFILNQKDYKDLFLKQNLLILKKFDSLKKYANAENNINKNIGNFDKSTFLIYYNILQSEVFPYLYMLPSFSNTLLELSSSSSFFNKNIFKFFSFSHIEQWYSNLIFGIKDFWSFLKIKFFYFNFSFFFKKLSNDKLVVNAFFQSKINQKLLEDEKFYLLSINSNIDPEGLDYLGDYNLWHYLYKENLTEGVDENFLFNDFLEFYNISFFYEMEKDFLKIFFSFSESLDVLYFRLFLFLKNNFSYSFNLIKIISKNLLLENLFLKELFFSNSIVSFLEDSFFSNLYEAEVNQELLRNIYFSPSFIRTFLLEKTSKLKERGLIKLYNSCISFLKKYFLINYLVSSNFLEDNFFFSSYKLRQQDYDFYKNFSGESHFTWCFFPFSTTFSSDFLGIVDEYLKIGSKSDLKNEKYKYYVFRTSSGGFFKYSSDFFFKLNSNKDIFNLSDQKSFFSSEFLYFTMLLNLIRIKNIIIKK